MANQEDIQPVPQDGISPQLTDKEALEVAKDLVEAATRFYKESPKNPTTKKPMPSIKERIEENKKYMFGRQIYDIKYKRYSAKLVDNIIYESMRSIKPMALSRLPDMILKPGDPDNETRQKIAEMLSKSEDNAIKARDRRKAFGLAFKQQPVYFISAIKRFWNPEKGKWGDHDLRVVHPDRLTIDHLATSNDTKDMRFVDERISSTVQEMIMKFPDKQEQIYAELELNGVIGDKKQVDKKALNTVVDYHEIWFVWFEKKADGYERQVWVMWYYKNLMLERMLHPYWDWKGEQRIVDYQNLSVEQKQQGVMMDLMKTQMGQTVSPEQTQKYYKNFMETCEFPYIFMGYDQWGEMPLDETSPIEQVRLLQFNYDKRGRQITEMIDKSAGKNVWSSIAGLKKDDLETQDPNDPDEDLFATGSLTGAFQHVDGPQVTNSHIQDKTELRNRIFDKMGVHGPARGEIDPNTPATNNQISREGDFTVMDDVSDEMITAMCEKTAQWDMQFIKLFYRPEQMEALVGQEGKELLKAVQYDLIEDGMEIEITASGTDKLRRKQAAVDNAKMGMSDPYHYYKDTEQSDPIGRTEDLFMWMNQPDLYIQKLKGKDVNGMVTQLNGGGGGSQLASQAIMAIQSGQIPQVPPTVDAGYLQTFQAFMADPNGAAAVIQKNPQLQEPLIQFAQQIAERAKQQPQTAPPPAQAPQPGMQPGSQSAGPVTTGNPQPGNTSQVPLAQAN